MEQVVIKSNLKWLRVKKGYTQKDFAAKIKVSRPYLSNLEKGKVYPKLNVLISICNALDVEIEEIFDFKEQE